MKEISFLACVVLLALSLTSCDHVLHNGTELDVSQVKVTGLPEAAYPTGTEMVLSYDTTGSNNWIHDVAADFANPRYAAKVESDRSWTLKFDPPLKITTSWLVFLLIDRKKNWDTTKITTLHSGKDRGTGHNVFVENEWLGVTKPVSVNGTVDGDNVTWVVE